MSPYRVRVSWKTSFPVFGLVCGLLLLTAYWYVECNEQCIFERHFLWKTNFKLTIYAFKGEESIRHSLSIASTVIRHAETDYYHCCMNDVFANVNRWFKIVKLTLSVERTTRNLIVSPNICKSKYMVWKYVGRQNMVACEFKNNWSWKTRVSCSVPKLSLTCSAGRAMAKAVSGWPFPQRTRDWGRFFSEYVTSSLSVSLFQCSMLIHWCSHHRLLYSHSWQHD
jgi:hypothetical protein